MRVISDTGWVDGVDVDVKRVLEVDLEGEEAWAAVHKFSFPICDNVKATASGRNSMTRIELAADLGLEPPPAPTKSNPWWKFW